MAPEQISGRRGDARTDIYALGTILYEMLTANLPYEGANVYAVMKAKASQDPQPPSRWVPDLDPRLEEIVLHAIERTPRNRYSSAAAMLADLEDLSRVQPTGRAARLHPRASWKRFRAVIMTGIFFVSLIAVFVMLVYLARRYPAAPARTQGSYRGSIR
jgi:serine/threonine protein kinase